jgi:signal peptidase I
MIQTAALQLDPAPVSSTAGGGGHGPECHDESGALACVWPEQHDGSFAAVLPSPDHPVAKARSKRTMLDRLLTSLIVALGVVAVAVGILVFVANLHFQTVTSGSMRPAVSPGDMAITQAVPISSLRVGDAIVFFPPNSAQAVLHRITSLDNGAIRTRGDANSVDDPWQVTLTGATAYRMVAVVPFLAWLTELQRPALLLAGLLLGLAILLELRKEVKTRGKKSQP